MSKQEDSKFEREMKELNGLIDKIEKEKDVRKPHNYWKERENVQVELRRVSDKLGHFPSWIDLKKADEHAIIQGIRNHHDGSLLNFRNEMGYPAHTMKPEGYWTEFTNLESELNAIVGKSGHFPTSSELKYMGRRDILNALNNFQGLMKVRQRMGYGNLTGYDIMKANVVKRLEERFGEPLEKVLQREYVENHNSLKNINSFLGTGHLTTIRLLKKYGIKIRSSSETLAPKGLVVPSKDELKNMQEIEGKSLSDIAKTYDVATIRVKRWFNDCALNVKSSSELAIIRRGIPKPSKEELEHQYTDQNIDRANIGKKYGVDGSTIKNWLIEYEIPIKKTINDYLVEVPRKKLEKLYLEENKTVNQVAQSIGVPLSIAKSLIIKNGLKKGEIPIPNKKELITFYVEKHENLNALGERYEATSGTVRRWLNHYNIPIRNLSQSKLPSNFIRPSNEELRRQYEFERLGTVEMGASIGVSYATVTSWLKEMGVEIRDKRGMYGSKKTRLETAKELLKVSKKTPQTLSTADFNCKNSEGLSFLGLLGWYRRNHKAKNAKARNILLEDLFSISSSESIYSSRNPQIHRTELKEWDNYKAAIVTLFLEHPELGGKLPSNTWFKNNGGYHHLLQYSSSYGGISKIREKLGQPILRHKSDYLRDFDKISSEITDLMNKHSSQLQGSFPSNYWLARNGYLHIYNAVRRHHGGIESVKLKMGYSKESESNSEINSSSLLEGYVHE